MSSCWQSVRIMNKSRHHLLDPLVAVRQEAKSRVAITLMIRMAAEGTGKMMKEVSDRGQQAAKAVRIHVEGHVDHRPCAEMSIQCRHQDPEQTAETGATTGAAAEQVADMDTADLAVEATPVIHTNKRHQHAQQLIVMTCSRG